MGTGAVGCGGGGVCGGGGGDGLPRIAGGTATRIRASFSLCPRLSEAFSSSRPLCPTIPLDPPPGTAVSGFGGFLFVVERLKEFRLLCQVAWLLIRGPPVPKSLRPILLNRWQAPRCDSLCPCRGSRWGANQGLIRVLFARGPVRVRNSCCGAVLLCCCGTVVLAVEVNNVEAQPNCSKTAPFESKDTSRSGRVER